ncbi:Hpt domain-containing protein [Benzoatithermus flavus]|uniref:Hpt domain-containing protein n=1 Tax=Benzoatithermus flavus TaxID=3108223 RepID=A0ABU8XSD1_9PROT
METTSFDPTLLERWRTFVAPGQLRQLALDFLAKLEEEVAGLGATLATGDRRLLAREAHALVGSAANFGAVRISTLARALELAAADADGTRLSDLHADLRAEVPRITASLKGWLETAGG